MQNKFWQMSGLHLFVSASGSYGCFQKPDTLQWVLATSDEIKIRPDYYTDKCQTETLLGCVLSKLGRSCAPLTYADNTYEHCSTNLLPSSLVLAWQPPTATVVRSPTVLETDATASSSSHILIARTLHLLLEMRQDAGRQIRSCSAALRASTIEELAVHWRILKFGKKSISTNERLCRRALGHREVQLAVFSQHRSI